MGVTSAHMSTKPLPAGTSRPSNLRGIAKRVQIVNVYPNRRKLVSKAQNLRCKEIYRADPIDVVQLVKDGVSSMTVIHMAREMKVRKEQLYSTLGLPRSTIDRKILNDKPLTSGETSKIVGIAKLVGQVQSSANSLADTSAQLGSAAAQTGSARQDW